MKGRKIDIDGDELFFYVGLDTSITGMPMIVWAPDSLAKAPHLRVQLGHWRESRPNDACLVSIGNNPRRLGGKGLRNIKPSYVPHYYCDTLHKARKNIRVKLAKRPEFMQLLPGLCHVLRP
jgi:hypothetical protein